MFRLYRRVFPGIVLAGLVLCLAALAGPGFTADTAPLPARQWNQENLERIKGLAAEPLTFAVLGDSRDNPAVFGRILQKVDRDPNIAFVIHLGDLVSKANLQDFQTFFEEVRLSLHKPLLAVIGNHEFKGEQGPEFFRQIFGPEDFAFQLDQHYFIMLNDSDRQGIREEQFRWLEAELQKSQDCLTRMVFLHIPLFDPNYSEKPHCLKPAEAARLLTLLKKYKVARIFAGHLHSYYAGDWDGVSYTITGGAGAPLYGTSRHAFYHYVKVTVQDKQVQIEVRPLSEAAGSSGD